MARRSVFFTGAVGLSFLHFRLEVPVAGVLCTYVMPKLCLGETRRDKPSVVLSVVPALHHRLAAPATQSSPTASLLSWPHRERASRDLSFCFVVAGWVILNTELTVSREGQVEGASFTVHGLLCTGCLPPPPPPHHFNIHSSGGGRLSCFCASVTVFGTSYP